MSEDSSYWRRWLWLVLTLLVVGLAGAVAFTAVGQVSAQPGLITGVVTDPAGGLPPAGAIVHLASPDGAVHGQAAVDPATGEFSLGPVANGNYILQAKPPAGSPFTPSLPEFLVVTGGPVNVGTLALTEPSIVGTVYAPDGTTPATALVHVYRGNFKVQSSLAPGGAIQLGGLLSGTYALQAEPVTGDPYWLSPRSPVTITDGVTQTIQLTLRPANVAGFITDPVGAPVGGATVHVLGLTSHHYRRDQSNPSGYFAIGDLVDDTYVLRVEPPWYADGLASPPPITFTVPPPFTNLGQIALLTAPKVVQGIVETNTGVPVENARVLAHRLDHPGRQQTLTAADGAYHLRLSGGLWSLTVEHTPASNPSDWIYPYPPQLVYFQHNMQPEWKTVHFEVLTADAHVIGVVEMPGGGAPPFTVTVHLRTNEGVGRSQAIDPASGSFDIAVPHGNYILTVQPHDPAYAGPPPTPVYAPENGTVDVGTLTLIARDATISGLVLNSQGQGVGGVRVVAWSRHTPGAQSWTNPDGSYALAVTAGEWLVRPVPPPTLPYVYDGQPISVTVASMQHVTGTDFVLTDANNQVVGQLVGPNGAPVHAYGWAAAADEGGPVNGAPIIGGNFTIYLPDGAYQVGVHLAPGSPWLVGPLQPVALSGGVSVSLTMPLLPQNANIVGALWDPRQEIVPTGVNGQVVANNSWAWVSDAINPANGTYQLGVSAGLWHLSYGVDPASGYVALDHHKVIPVQAGQTAAVPLPVVERDSLLQGVVLDPDGLPLAGAAVVANGLGRDVSQVMLRIVSGADGSFRLAVPHGLYRLYASHAQPGWLNPATRAIFAPPGGVTGGILLQFREPDVTLSGTTAITGGLPSSGRVHIWAYSDEGAATKTTVTLGDNYALGLLSNTDWHVGAVLETGNAFYAMRATVQMGAGDETLDLVLAGPFPKPGPVVVSFDASQPQSLELADGTGIFIPAGAMPVSGTVTLHITPIATLPHQHHAHLYKYGYAFVATDASGAAITSHFNQNVIIAFGYDEAELAALNLDEMHLKPAYFSTSTQSWTIPDNYVVDTAANRVVMQIDHFTDYSLLADPIYTAYVPIIFQ
ncbi:MAG: carboxypeptidase-like regulatory domain-containing protein [Chloroflexi bacterium]|nr:carboxypeptidase-like regulatory domain-containing protein [Chloroflexota bacterium]MCI0578648.1 carboxypeptidase-like regulatory domain-containing protein [Chloroflexota bacterium]MCI0647221.1 carboxypeptidase-like regulatory domain-containing protein [Chloroflexota bacterium]MCI0728947.1 carboxypeptidase-like regulatory domain-containing protein [Chloroflexota bacterium]